MAWIRRPGRGRCVPGPGIHLVHDVTAAPDVLPPSAALTPPEDP